MQPVCRSSAKGVTLSVVDQGEQLDAIRANGLTVISGQTRSTVQVTRVDGARIVLVEVLQNGGESA